jgi:hypothetical protein
MKNLGKETSTPGLRSWGQTAGKPIKQNESSKCPGQVTKKPGGGKKG